MADPTLLSETSAPKIETARGSARFRRIVLCWFAALALGVCRAEARPCDSADDDAIRARLRGDVAMLRGRYDEAVGRYGKCVDDPKCRLGLGLGLVEMGRLDQARPVLLDSFKRYPTDPRLLRALRIVNDAEIEGLERALSQRRSCRRSAASTRERLLTLHEQNRHFGPARILILDGRPEEELLFTERLRLARLYLSCGQFVEAGQRFEALAQLSSDPRTVLLAAADGYLAGAAFVRAERILLKLVHKWPGPDLDLRLASIYLQTSRFHEARTLYGAYPQVPAAKVGLALSLVELGEYAEARPLLLEVTRIDPANAQIRNGMKIVNEAEIRDLEHELRHLRPDDEVAGERRWRLIKLYAQNGHQEEGCALARFILNRTGPCFEKLIRLAVLFDGWCRHRMAGQCYEQAAQVSPDRRATLLAAVDAYLTGSLNADADRVIRSIARSRPGSDLDLRTARFYLQTGRVRQAEDLYSRHPNQVDARLGLGLCLVRQHRFEDAAPFLLAASLVRPTDPRLLKALKCVREAEIARLRHELPSLPRGSHRIRAVKERLLTLYEQNGLFEEARDILLSQGPIAEMDLEQLLHLARLHTSCEQYVEAGLCYERAARLSPNPRLTLLGAVDAFLAGHCDKEPERLLRDVAHVRRGPDLDVRFARLFGRTDRLREARTILERCARRAEEEAYSWPDPRAARLFAVDCYTSARLYDEALRVLSHPSMRVPGKDADLRFARVYTALEAYPRALAIYDEYPDAVDMQLSKGYTLLDAGLIGPAKITFMELMAELPENEQAIAGLLRSQELGPWDLLIDSGTIDLGTAHSRRQFLSGSLGYTYKRAVTTVLCTRAQSVDLRPGDADLREDIYGLKMQYRLNSRLFLSAEGRRLKSNDTLTDGGQILGVQLSYGFLDLWTIGLGLASTEYPTAQATQFTANAGVRVKPDWRLDLLALLGSQELNAPYGGDTSTGAAKATVTYAPNRRFMVSLSAWIGKRLLEHDPDVPFVYDTLDTYQGGATLVASYRLLHPLKAFVRFSELPFSANRGSPAFDQTEKVSMLGLDASF